MPAWAYLDVTHADAFNITAAELGASLNLPESTAIPTPSATSTPTSQTTAVSMPTSSAVTQSTASSAPSVSPTASESSSTTRSSTGPLVGGLVGGLGGAALLSAVLFFIFRQRRRTSAVASPAQLYHAGPADGDGSKAAYDYGSTPHSAIEGIRLYNPDDPATFPTLPAAYLSPNRNDGSTTILGGGSDVASSGPTRHPGFTEV